MFNLTLGKTTGKQVYAIIDKAMKERRRATGANVVVGNFCKASGLSKSMIYRYKAGEKPKAEGLAKIAQGLRAWDIEVVVSMDAAASLR